MKGTIVKSEIASGIAKELWPSSANTIEGTISVEGKRASFRLERCWVGNTVIVGSVA
jgi:hypothetical protein